MTALVSRHLEWGLYKTAVLKICTLLLPLIKLKIIAQGPIYHCLFSIPFSFDTGKTRLSLSSFC